MILIGLETLSPVKGFILSIKFHESLRFYIQGREIYVHYTNFVAKRVLYLFNALHWFQTIVDSFIKIFLQIELFKPC